MEQLTRFFYMLQVLHMLSSGDSEDIKSVNKFVPQHSTLHDPINLLKDIDDASSQLW